ncbi:hypothetical protein Moror_4597 [Moniliophthora roreri MCA 2997]|uniref:Uncharacterized protein n=1 Tax=Moniliophthora roreri (strain MCA 2997) TaxID=1381753 RepID=V2YKZ4_MONRO|nr:hypothetical protein Moror_4597 [Moniliophthora roreri MCA 2997]
MPRAVAHDRIERLQRKTMLWKDLETQDGTGIHYSVTFVSQFENFIYGPTKAVELEMKYDDGIHGRSGPFQKTFPRYIDAVTRPWWEAPKSFGVAVNPDSVGYSPIYLCRMNVDYLKYNGHNTGLFIATKGIDHNANEAF